MGGTQRGYTERFMFLGVFDIADAEAADVEQSHPERSDTPLGQSPSGQVARYRFPQGGQGLPEFDYPLELGSIPLHAPLLVIEVLAPSGRVRTDDLDMPMWPRTNPYIDPGRWNDERSDAIQYFSIGDSHSIARVVGEAASTSVSGDAGTIDV
jgi:hypothetical protein